MCTTAPRLKCALLHYPKLSCLLHFIMTQESRNNHRDSSGFQYQMYHVTDTHTPAPRAFLLPKAGPSLLLAESDPPLVPPPWSMCGLNSCRACLSSALSISPSLLQSYYSNVPTLSYVVSLIFSLCCLCFPTSTVSWARSSHSVSTTYSWELLLPRFPPSSSLARPLHLRPSSPCLLRTEADAIAHPLLRHSLSLLVSGPHLLLGFLHLSGCSFSGSFAGSSSSLM